MKSSLYVSISIPVKPHVKKYLAVRYGTEHSFSKTSLLGVLLLHVLDKKRPKSDCSFDDYKEKYTVNISERYFQRSGFEIPLKKRRYLAVCMDKIFAEDFNLFVDIEVSNGKNITESMQKFLFRYGITENDVKFESLYRNYHRYLAKNNPEKENKNCLKTA